MNITSTWRLYGSLTIHAGVDYISSGVPRSVGRPPARESSRYYPQQFVIQPTLVCQKGLASRSSLNLGPSTNSAGRSTQCTPASPTAVATGTCACSQSCSTSIDCDEATRTLLANQMCTLGVQTKEAKIGDSRQQIY